MNYNGSEYAAIPDLFGISCIEENLLCYCVKNHLPYQSLYSSSYVSILHVLQDFLDSNAEYANYYQMPRLHKYAKEQGLVDTQFLSCSFAEMKELALCKLAENEIVTVQIDPRKVVQYQDNLPWRFDHYVMIEAREGAGFIFYDKIKNMRYYLEDQVLEEAYMQSVILFQTLMFADISKVEQMVLRELEKIRVMQECELPVAAIVEKYDFSGTAALRDAVGMIRISRARLQSAIRWYAQFGNTVQLSAIADLLNPLVEGVSIIYTIIEMGRLRRNLNTQKLVEKFEQMMAYESQWKIELFSLM